MNRKYIHLKMRLYKWSLAIWAQLPAILKRLFDIGFSVVVLLSLLPVFLLIGFLVSLDSGPVFFSQSRIGKSGRSFKMYKFRTMCVDAESRLTELMSYNEKGDGITFKMTHDPRVTKVGYVLRRLSLDELPQIWNVLVGEMSIVGPRPCLPQESLKIDPEFYPRFMVRPGLTCLWQIGERGGGLFEIGNRNSIDFHEQAQLDIKYIQKRSLIRDLWIILKTIPALLMGK